MCDHKYKKICNCLTDVEVLRERQKKTLYQAHFDLFTGEDEQPQQQHAHTCLNQHKLCFSFICSAIVTQRHICTSGLWAKMKEF